MSVFTNYIFNTGSVQFEKEANTNYHSFVSMSFGGTGALTASFLSSYDSSTMGRDSVINLGSTRGSSLEEKWGGWSFSRLSAPGTSQGYMFFVSRQTNSYTSALAGPGEPSTDWGIGLYQPFGVAASSTPVRVGGGLTYDPFNADSSEKMRFATLVVSGALQDSYDAGVDTGPGTIVRIDQGLKSTTDNPKYPLGGCHLQFLRGDSYYNRFGDNTWLGIYAAKPDADQTDIRGSFYGAFGAYSTRSSGVQPPELADTNSSNGFQWLLVTQSATYSSGKAAYTLIGSSDRASDSTGTSFLLPSASLHVLGDGASLNEVAYNTDKYDNNLAYTAIFEGASTGMDGTGGVTSVGIHAARSRKYNTTGPAISVALSAYNYRSGNAKAGTTAADFGILLTQPTDASSNQKGPQVRMWLTNSGSMAVFSGSQGGSNYRTQFPPKGGFLNNGYYNSGGYHLIPTGTLSLYGIHDSSASGPSGQTAPDVGWNSPPILNLINFRGKSSLTDAYPNTGDILGRITFRANVYNETYDGLGSYIEAAAASNWAAATWGTELSFYTRSTEKRPIKRLTIDEDGKLVAPSQLDLYIGATRGITINSTGMGVNNAPVSGYSLVTKTVGSDRKVLLGGDTELDGHLKVSGNQILDSGGVARIGFDGIGNIDQFAPLKGLGLGIHLTETTTDAQVTLRRSKDDGITTTTVIGDINFHGSEDDSTYLNMAKIECKASGVFNPASAGAQNAMLRFYTNGIDSSADSVTERFVIGQGGTDNPYQPAFMAYRSSHGSQVTNDSYSTIVFETEHFDVGADYNTSTGEFTCPRDGKYFFSVSVTMDNNSTDSTYYYLLLQHSGGETRGKMVDVTDIFNSAPTYYAMGIDGIFDCSMGDTVKASFYQSGGSGSVRFLGITTGGGVNSARSSFSGYLLG